MNSARLPSKRSDLKKKEPQQALWAQRGMKPSTQSSKEESTKIGNLTRRATTFGAAAVIGLAALGATGTAGAQGAKGKTVEYIAFGLRFEY